MTQTIVGVFDKLQEAQSAAEDLISHGFGRGDVKVVKEDAAQPGTSIDLLSDADLPADDARQYAEELRNGASLVAVKAVDTDAPRALDILKAHGLADVSTVSSGTASGATGGELRPGQTVPIIEEQMQVGKQKVRQGGVRIHSRVVEQPVEAEVRLREERAEVERRAVDRPATEADLNAFKEGTVEIRETVEEPVVSKQARVVGEVDIGKQVEERTETVRDTVRRTEVDVEKLGSTEASRASMASGSTIDESKATYNTPVDQTREATASGPMGIMRESVSERTFDSAEADFRRDFESKGYGGKYRYEQFRPAYRYGYDMAVSRNLQGTDWKTLEPDARRRWEELNPGTWDRFKNAVHYAWEKIRGQA